MSNVKGNILDKKSIKNKKEKTKKSNSVSKVGFIICIVVGFAIGLLSGMDLLSADAIKGLSAKVIPYIYNLSVLISLIISTIGSAVILIVYKKVKKLVIEAQTNDSLFDKADKQVDLLSVVITILYTVSMILAILAFKYIFDIDTKENVIVNVIPIIIGISMFVEMFILQKIYKLNNMLTPNINFNVMDMRTFTTAENQTDEAQKQILYKAAYKTVGICANTLIGVGVVLALLGLALGFSIITGLILLISGSFIQIVFNIKTYQLSH